MCILKTPQKFSNAYSNGVLHVVWCGVVWCGVVWS